VVLVCGIGLIYHLPQLDRPRHVVNCLPVCNLMEAKLHINIGYRIYDVRYHSIGFVYGCPSRRIPLFKGGLVNHLSQPERTKSARTYRLNKPLGNNLSNYCCRSIKPSSSSLNSSPDDVNNELSGSAVDSVQSQESCISFMPQSG